MKMQKFVVIFAKKHLKINIWKKNKCCKVRDHCHYLGEYRGAVHSICNLKYSVPIKIPIDFLTMIIFLSLKESAEEFKKQFACLEEKTVKCIIFTVPIEKEVTRIDKNGEEIWQAHYQIFQAH